MFEEAKSWPFHEARALLAHVEAKGKKPGDLVTFETGYGPSGAPHIGTFGEVVRTLWVMRAFNELTQNAYQTRLIMFSDDYDALRKVPDDMPAWMEEHLGRPLSHVPSPYSWDDVPEASFGQANNEKLAMFVEPLLAAHDGGRLGNISQGARYGMVSATEYYQGGAFNEMLDRVWDEYQAILDILLPTFKDERRLTYSPFMVKGDDGILIHKGVGLDSVRGYVTVGDRAVAKIHDGGAKLQWYVDWAMRWAYFDVDYEMSGKDLMDSVKLSGQICRVLGGVPPLNLTYELFLDEQGAKISKSRGNGFTIEEWLTYGTHGSLMLLMFQDPRKAKKLYKNLVPQLEDQYLKLRGKVATVDDAHWHFTTTSLAPLTSDVSYSLLLNLAIVSQVRTADDLMAYLQQSRAISPGDAEITRQLASLVIRYAEDEGLFNRERREPTDQERAAFRDLANRFEAMLPTMDAEAYQYQVYEVGKAHGFQPLRSWFKALYECLLGASEGPRFGALTQAFGLDNTVQMLRSAGEEVAR